VREHSPHIRAYFCLKWHRHDIGALFRCSLRCVGIILLKQFGIQQVGARTWGIVAVTVTLPQLGGRVDFWPFLLLLPSIPAFMHMCMHFYLCYVVIFAHVCIFSGAIVIFPRSPKDLYITRNDKDAAIKSINFYHGNDANTEEIFATYEQEKNMTVVDIFVYILIHKNSHLDITKSDNISIVNHTTFTHSILNLLSGKSYTDTMCHRYCCVLLNW
jgi:hypothetical protein